ncbi:MAG: hypothetical protein R3174_13050 [Gammaproteobacteria bacterium]|nr:hypothetical protein [Gammaproteobacteria bacterium]
MRSRASNLAGALLLIAGLIPPAGSVAGGDAAWHYTLGEVRENQQGNFCNGADDVTELALIFRKYGVLPGFSALSGSPNCATRVGTFTPHEIVEVVVIEEGKPNEYMIRFLLVEMHGGERSYLVTTRDVMPANN